MMITIPSNAVKSAETIDANNETLEVITYTWYKGDRAYSYAYYSPKPMIVLQ